jgi:AbrB family looped-hinge helix DNA binding protein
MSTESTLTSKGQTTVPKAIRDSLRLKPGDRITFTPMPDGTVLMRVKNKSVMSLAGSLRRRGRKALSVDELSR